MVENRVGVKDSLPPGERPRRVLGVGYQPPVVGEALKRSSYDMGAPMPMSITHSVLGDGLEPVGALAAAGVPPGRQRRPALQPEHLRLLRVVAAPLHLGTPPGVQHSAEETLRDITSRCRGEGCQIEDTIACTRVRDMRGG